MDPVSLLVATTVFISWQLMDSPRKAKWMLIPHACHAHGEWHRVVSHAFVHADWMHLAFNMFVLYEFGQTVMLDLAPLGWMGFPAMYFAGIVAGALPALRKHRFNPGYRSLGASGQSVPFCLLSSVCIPQEHSSCSSSSLFLPFLQACCFSGTRAECSAEGGLTWPTMPIWVGHLWVSPGCLPACPKASGDR